MFLEVFKKLGISGYSQSMVSRMTELDGELPIEAFRSEGFFPNSSSSNAPAVSNDDSLLHSKL
jgi:hypothetical protein